MRGSRAIAKKLRTILRSKVRAWPKKSWRSVRRGMRRLTPLGALTLVTLTVCGFASVYNIYMAHNRDNTNYTPLLDTIAKGESKGNYNAHYGNAGNTSVRFTNMTIAEVLQWQSDFIDQGHKSSAVGKYQIVRPTLRGLVAQLKIDPNKTRFDEKTQDRLAVALLERRGAHEYMNGKMTREEFAANLAKEWAALPKATGSNPTQGYYDGDGLNKVQISIDEMYAALAIIKQ